MNNMNYNQRQCQLIGDLVRLFQGRKISISQLIGKLKALVRALEGIDPSWEEAILAEWGALEMIYASALDKHERGLIHSVNVYLNEPEAQIYISKAIDNILELLQSPNSPSRITSRG
jgi:hypothetical protein